MPSLSNSTFAWTYDVFLNFRGDDTRHRFTSYLYDALSRTGSHVFMDDSAIERGEDISASLLHAIQRSRIAIIVFSEDYASSRWCLDELLQIMECRRIQAQVVVPVFYNVSPSDVRHQRGNYGEAMKQHEQSLGRGSDLVLRWRQALKAAANLAGLINEASD
ncbi:hypothetical protein QN277_023186 [Acacia crassicarpa]|uniref:TIR domain-containing protein n=1 Tax=Acacia crassicarpa TaxID=499986 RepID=A0AAE1JJI9_9FABA|nr:hypothetical protein QN277_023186 [Acacia crassicarpa]